MQQRLATHRNRSTTQLLLMSSAKLFLTFLSFSFIVDNDDLYAS